MTPLPCVSPPSPAAIRVSVALYFSPGSRVKYCLMPSVAPPKRLPPITATVPAAGTISSPPRTEAPAPHAISKPLTAFRKITCYKFIRSILNFLWRCRIQHFASFISEIGIIYQRPLGLNITPEAGPKPFQARHCIILNNNPNQKGWDCY